MRQTKNYGWKVVQRTDGRPDIEQVTNVFDSIDEKVKQLDDKDTFVSNKVNEIDGKLTQTSQKVTELAGAVTQAETEITALDGRVTGLENATIEIATVEEAIAGERNDIAMSPYTTKQAHYAWGGGGRGNVFIRSKSTNSFTANTETTTFTISDFKDTYMIELIFKNLSLVEDVDYRLNSLTGEVTLLTFSLKTGDTIYYNIFDTKAQVFKSGQKQGEFVAKEEIGTFTIPDFNNEKQATLIFDGLVLLENNEYTITNQGVVTLLNWTLKIGEKITYLIETTSYDYNELSNKPAIPTVDVDKAYVDNKVGDTTALQTTNKTNLVSAVNELKKDKIDKSQIKNSLTETNTGNVLDASQGKILKDDINTRALKTEVGTLSGLVTTVKSSIVNAINEVSGYIGKLQSLATNAKTSLVDAINENTNEINDLSTNKAGKTYVDEQDLKSMNYKSLTDNTRLYMTTQTGIYLTPASGVTDLPEGWAQGRHTLVCFNPSNDLYGFQLITTYAGSAGLGGNRKFAIRHAMTEGSKWLELATTEQIDTLSNRKFIRSDANTDGRDNPTKPSDYVLGLFTNQIKTFKSIGLSGGGFAHIIGINEWTDTTAGVHELIFAGTKVYHRESVSANAWGQLHELATTTKTDISFPFTGSYMSRGGYVSKVTKDAMGLVTINVTFQINDGSTLLPQGNNIIGTLPVGYRPQGIVAGVGSTAFGGNMVNVRVTVGSDGVVTCTTGNGYTGSNVIGFSISYYV